MFCPKCEKIILRRIKFLERLQKKQKDQDRDLVISQLKYVLDRK